MFLMFMSLMIMSLMIMSFTMIMLFVIMVLMTVSQVVLCYLRVHHIKSFVHINLIPHYADIFLNHLLRPQR